jgi:hypothetical protein
MAKADKDTKTKDNYRPMFPINKLTQLNAKKCQKKKPTTSQLSVCDA